MSNRPIHFDIQAEDPERAKSFYEKTFGWKVEKAPMGGEMDYWMVDTGTGPGIGGGMSRKGTGNDFSDRFDCTIIVPDIDKALEEVKANGGQVTMEKSELKGVGWFARCRDTENNKFGLMQGTDWQPE
jgi:predicted enzyme related to lactoylglutathione lyase